MPNNKDKKSDAAIRADALFSGLTGAGFGSMLGSIATRNKPTLAKVLPKIFRGSFGAGAYAAHTYNARKKQKNMVKSADVNGDWQKDQLFLGGLLAGGTGGALLRNAYHSGDITGRATLFHGTKSEDKARSIREKGLLRTTPESINEFNRAVLQSRSGDVYRNSLGKSYMTKDPIEALFYGNLRPKNVVKLNVPLWKYKQVVNPEIADGYKAFSDDADRKLRNAIIPQEPNLQTDLIKTKMYNKLRDSAVVEGDVSPEHIKGSDKYVKNSIKEIKEYIKARPWQFAKGVGKAGLGLGLLGGGGLMLKDSLSD